MRYARKDPNDKFYTSLEVAKNLVNNVNFEDFDIAIEPSAGGGSFIDAIKQVSPIEIVGLDTTPTREDIKQFNFFDYTHLGDKSKTLVIGNPPFGKQNNLAIKFVNHAMSMANTVAFILPLSFKKVSVQNKINLDFVVDQQFDVKSDAFEFEGQPYDVPTAFQIWKWNPGKRSKLQPETPIGWKYTTKENANLAVRRVGFYAGRAYEDCDKNKESFFFISTRDVKKLADYLNAYEWKYGDTVGPRTVSKHQLNRVINNFLSSDGNVSGLGTDRLL